MDRYSNFADEMQEILLVGATLKPILDIGMIQSLPAWPGFRGDWSWGKDETLPAAAETPVDGPDDEAERDREGEPHGVVEGAAPVGGHVLLQQQRQLPRLPLRESVREAERLAARLGLPKAGNQLLILPARQKQACASQTIIGLQLFMCSVHASSCRGCHICTLSESVKRPAWPMNDS